MPIVDSTKLVNLLLIQRKQISWIQNSKTGQSYSQISPLWSKQIFSAHSFML